MEALEITVSMSTQRVMLGSVLVITNKGRDYEVVS